MPGRSERLLPAKAAAPPRPSASWRRPLAVLAVLALVTALLTYPMAARAPRVGPVNTGDGQWSIWSTCWVARTLVVDPLHLYDANIFSPHPRTLAYSEANIVGGVLAAPAWWATRNPYFAYNSAILLSFLVAALAAFALARRLTGSTAPAFAGAVAFAFAPAVIVRLAHIQLLMTLGLPLALLALHRFVERQAPLRVAALALALVVAALCNGYYGIAAGVACALGFVYYAMARGLWRQPRYWTACAAVVVLAGLIVLPFFLPYLELERGGTVFRSIDETRRYSADWRSYLTSTTHVQRWLLAKLVPFDATAFPERVLFPGFVACVLAAFALISAARLRLRPTASASTRASADARDNGRAGFSTRESADARDNGRAGLSTRESADARDNGRAGLSTRESADARDNGRAGLQPCPRETVGFYALLAFTAAWLSFGPAAGLYWLFYRFVPGFSLTRAPARLGVLVMLAVAMLAAMGLAAILRAVERPRRPSRGRLLAAGVVGALVAELAAVPLDLRNALPVPSAHRALASLTAGAVAEFPYFFLERDIYRNSLYMLYSTAHWHPLVNGYSDFIPGEYRKNVVAISTFPSREAFRLLRERRARYAVFHLNLYDRRSREKLMDAIGRYRDFLRPLVQADEVWLYEIVAWP